MTSGGHLAQKLWARWEEPSRRLLASSPGWLPGTGLLRKALASNYKLRALSSYAAGSMQEAVDWFNKAAILTPNDQAIFAFLGQIHYEQGELQEAKQFFARTIQLAPENFQALKGMAFTLHALGDLKEAMFLYLKCLERNKDDFRILLNLGIVLHSLQRYDEAIEYYRRASEIEPENYVVHENWGRAFYSMGRIEDAFQALQRARQLGPTDPDVHHLLGLLFESRGDSAKALDSVKVAAQLSPDNPDVLLDLSRLFEESQSHNEAAEKAQEAAAVYKATGDQDGEARAYWQLGWVYYQKADWDESVRYSTAALDLNRDLLAARFNLALALLRRGDIENARNHYQVAAEGTTQASDIQYWGIDDLEGALKKNPHLPGASELLETLRERCNTLREALTSPSAAAV